jgi:glycosyltransferase involved in cell wall biosynthesis
MLHRQFLSDYRVMASPFWERLGAGAFGAMERLTGTRVVLENLAWALGVPVVPSGMSGCPDAFRGSGLALRGGEVRVRFGAAYALRADLLPRDFRPFDPDLEAREQAALRRATAELITRLDGFLDERYRRAEGFVHDGSQGTRRFL